MTQVVLVFPPLVETNFGHIYPSTAVLAAYLAPRGFPVVQVDLNTIFFDHIVSEEELVSSSEGVYRSCRPETVAAARWTRCRLGEGSLSRPDMLTAHRRHPIHSVMRLLVKPYSVDPDQLVLDGSTSDPHVDASYDRFFTAHLDGIVQHSSADTIFGLSVPMGPQLLPALRLASILRTALDGPRSRIVLGGPALSLLGTDDLTRLLENNPAVDCIVRFDGEIPLHALAEQLVSGEWTPERVPGTSSWREKRAYHSEPVGGPTLNSLPTPLYSAELVASAPDARLGVIQARGCYWGKCDYCDFVEVYKGSPAYRSRSAELVVDDIRRLAEQTGIRRYRVITEAIPPAFAHRFSELLCESELDIQWSSFVMVDKSFDYDLLRLMAASGCDLLVVGLESMVTRALKLVHKSADREQNIRFLTDARKAGIQLYVNLIPDLPSTTRDEALEGLIDLEKVAYCMSEANILAFEPTRSSRVGRAPESFGLVQLGSPGRPGHAQLAINTLPAVDPAMTAAERAEVFRAYQDFAAGVNTRNPGPINEANQQQYSVVIECLAGPDLFNFATMEYLRLRPTGIG